MALLLAGVMAIGPLLTAASWPARLRWIHATEITVFALPFAFLVSRLISTPAPE
jgi:hypothetical protein